MKQIRHEGTPPGKTLSPRSLAVTSRYLLYSSSFTLRHLYVELIRAVTVVDGRLYAGGLGLQVAAAPPVSIFVEDYPVTSLYHFAY